MLGERNFILTPKKGKDATNNGDDIETFWYNLLYI